MGGGTLLAPFCRNHVWTANCPEAQPAPWGSLFTYTTNASLLAFAESFVSIVATPVAFVGSIPEFDGGVRQYRPVFPEGWLTPHPEGLLFPATTDGELLLLLVMWLTNT